MGEHRRRVSPRMQQRLWSVYSRCYDGLLDLVPYQRLVEMVVDSLDTPPGAELVDLGCGTGNTIRALVDSSPDLVVTGVDSSPDMLRVAGTKFAHGEVRLVRSDILDWLRSAESGSLDRVVSVNVLYTMHAEDRAVFWAEALRALRPGGRMVLVSTDRDGVGPVIREHLDATTFRSSLTPRLLSILAMNMIIWAMEARRVFDPASAETLSEECEAAGGSVISVQRCYGGDIDGVDVLLVIEPVLDLSALPTPADAPASDADAPRSDEPLAVDD
jgi:ubiquinone/menaquinone biosynthesis C-methylase UbiE